MLQGGHPDAGRFLIAEYYRPLTRFLWHASACREDAEDLAAQTIGAAIKNSKRLRDPEQLRSWIFQIARRQLLQHRRRRLFWPSKQEAAGLTEGDLDGLFAIQDALGKLSSSHREAFLLTEVEGFSHQEAGLILHVPAGTVKSRAHHAKNRLRSLLQSTYPEVIQHAVINAE